MDLSLSFVDDALGLDTYARRARFYPASLVALPLALMVFAWGPGGAASWAPLWGLGVCAGGAFLLAQIAREAGKNQEPMLFERWGGKPTTHHLRWREAENPVLLERRHRQLEALTGRTLPTSQEEQKDPDQADRIYDVCVRCLRERTRDEERFPLVFEENCNYGFRRNLLGVRSYGIASSIAGFAGVVMLAHPKVPVSGVLPMPFLWAIGTICIALFFAWEFIVNVGWVRSKADAYAERLLGACDLLETDSREGDGAREQ